MHQLDDNSPAVIADGVDFCMANIEHPECTVDLAGRFYEGITTHLRAMGISYLLLDGAADAFYAELTISAQARRHYLARCAKTGYSDFHNACSRWGAFFDALASHAGGLAADIARLSPADWLAGDEYEDDYCYARFLHFTIAGGAAPDELEAILVRFEAALEGAASPRLAVCRALLVRDQAAFDTAFDELLLERRAEIAEERAGIAEEDICAALGTYVFVEGLALLRIAEGAGLKTRREYPLCPALARVPLGAAPPADTFPPI
jgi:hypothetical protein